MAKNNQKLIQQMKKRRIWPSITIFAVFFLLYILIFTFAVEFFASYVIGSKADRMYEETVQTEQNLADLLRKEPDLAKAVALLRTQVSAENAIYVLDANGMAVGEKPDSVPLLLEGSTVNFDAFIFNNILLAVDSEEPIQISGEDSVFLGMPFNELLAKTLDPSSEAQNPENSWLNETIFNARIWMSASTSGEPFTLYMRHTMDIKRQDIFYVFIICLVLLGLISIPMLFLFVNTLVSIINQRKITRLFYTDTVTGGKNWFYFQNQVQHIYRRIYNRKKAFAVVNLHLERYHNYCACHGVTVGEELLQGIDGFLKVRTARNECYGRHEGANFGLFLVVEGTNSAEYENNCKKRVGSLLAELTGLKPEQKIHFHAGVCMIEPLPAENGKYRRRKSIDINQVYHYANTARMSTKCREGQRITFFDQDMHDQQMWDRKVEERMEDALNAEEFKVYLQPKYTPSEGRLVGAEALVRWISPTDGFIPPNRFIPIFESNGFITQLDDYMISHVARLQAEWIIQKKKVVPISVNVSRAHFSQEGLAEHICQLVDAYGVKHELIELEVTESAFFEDKDILIETIKQLKAYGFHVSMDDFGSGYSSLNSLKDMPLDVLKLDMEFFHGDGDRQRREIIVQEAIQLARGLNMLVVAEGIEKKEQVDFLAELGCDMIQGFYFAKPLPVSEFEDKVEKDA